MTVKELKEQLSQYPDDMEVCVYGESLKSEHIVEDELIYNNKKFINIECDE